MDKKQKILNESGFTEEQRHEIKQYIIHQIMLDVIYYFKQNLEWIILTDIEIPLYEAHINLCWDEFSEETRKELLHDLEAKKRRAIILRPKQGILTQ